MSATYNEVLKRLIEERKRLGLSQKEMAQLVHITQSNYSKVEKGLHRLSYEELKYLSKAKVDIFYIFTGYRCVGKYVEYFQQYTYAELCCYLGIMYSLIVLNDCKSNTTQWKDIAKRVKYVPLVLDCKKSSNIFLVIRHMTDSRQKPMAEKLGVDIKKFRELEKDRCMPDSEIIWKLYNLFLISPAVVLKDKNSIINEISSLLETAEENGVEIIDIIKQI
mgnify:FL=1